jgi:hypothetical protein
MMLLAITSHKKALFCVHNQSVRQLTAFIAFLYYLNVYSKKEGLRHASRSRQG